MGWMSGWTRRARLAATGVTVAWVMVGGLVAPQPAGADGHWKGLLPEGDWTDDQVDEALDLIDRTEQALTTKFGRLLDEEGIQDLEGLGFAHFGLVAPGGWEHWVNMDWVRDDRIVDPEFPEWLVTRQDPDGRHEVWAAMYMLPPDYEMASIPEDVAWLPGWHHHPDEMCINDDGTFADFVDPAGECGSGSAAPPVPMMHIWINDTECGHRFGGVDATGLTCGDDPGHEDDHDGGEGDGEGDDRPVEAPPAPRVPGEPAFTG